MFRIAEAISKANAEGKRVKKKDIAVTVIALLFVCKFIFGTM